jgi:hypothetical protein
VSSLTGSGDKAVASSTSDTGAVGAGPCLAVTPGEQLKAVVTALFRQLKEGCGTTGCTNAHCATGSGTCLVLRHRVVGKRMHARDQSPARPLEWRFF